MLPEHCPAAEQQQQVERVWAGRKREVTTSAVIPLCVGNICLHRMPALTLPPIVTSLRFHILLKNGLLLKQCRHVAHFQMTTDQRAQDISKIKDNESMIKLAYSLPSI